MQFILCHGNITEQIVFHSLLTGSKAFYEDRLNSLHVQRIYSLEQMGRIPKNEQFVSLSRYFLENIKSTITTQAKLEEQFGIELDSSEVNRLKIGMIVWIYCNDFIRFDFELKNILFILFQVPKDGIIFYWGSFSSIFICWTTHQTKLRKWAMTPFGVKYRPWLTSTSV